VGGGRRVRKEGKTKKEEKIKVKGEDGDNEREIVRSSRRRETDQEKMQMRF